MHLWSLAVEEQFYLLWPLLAYCLPLTTFKRFVIEILILAPLVRFCLYFVFQGHDADWIGRNIYCLPFSQFDSFAAGAAIVLWRLRELQNAGRWLCFAILLAVVCGAAVLAHEHLVYRSAMKWTLGYSMFLLPVGGFVWGYALLNLLSATTIICALQQLPPLRLLEARPLVRLGEISYGVYMYHLPVLLLTEMLPLSRPAMFPAFVVVTLAISELSFRFLETPFLRLKSVRVIPTRVMANELPDMRANRDARGLASDEA